MEIIGSIFLTEDQQPLHLLSPMGSNRENLPQAEIRLPGLLHELRQDLRGQD